MDIDEMRRMAFKNMEARSAKFDDKATDEHEDERGMLVLPIDSTVSGVVTEVGEYVGDYGATPTLKIDDERGVLKILVTGVVLQGKLEGVQVGDFVAIKYKGRQLKKSAKAGSTKTTDSYHSFDASMVPGERVRTEPSAPESNGQGQLFDPATDYEPSNTEPFEMGAKEFNKALTYLQGEIEELREEHLTPCAYSDCDELTLSPATEGGWLTENRDPKGRFNERYWLCSGHLDQVRYAPDIGDPEDVIIDLFNPETREVEWPNCGWCGEPDTLNEAVEWWEEGHMPSGYTCHCAYVVGKD